MNKQPISQLNNTKSSMLDADFNPYQLRFAREKRKITKQRLSDISGISVRTISACENTPDNITDKTIENLANALNFPILFFYINTDEYQTINHDSISYRSQSKITRLDKNSALATAHMAIDIYGYIAEKIKLPSLNLPEITDVEMYSPEDIAYLVRAEWELGERPIKNMLHLLEAKGVRVFALPENITHVDAFSFCYYENAFIVMNTKKTAERSRFDLAHELGHLIMHQGSLSENSKLKEDEADRFASALLMPKVNFKASMPNIGLFSEFIKSKLLWKVSLMAYLRRARDLNYLSDWQYRTHVIQASQNGYKSGEPVGIDREYSFIWKKVDALLHEKYNTNIQNISLDIKFDIQDLNEMVLSLIEPKSNILKMQVRSETVVIDDNFNKTKKSKNNILKLYDK